MEPINNNNLDADEPIANDDDNESNDEIDDDEDDTSELLAELERIKKERYYFRSNLMFIHLIII